MAYSSRQFYQRSGSAGNLGANAAYGGRFDAASAMFAQADANQDGSIDSSEFQRWAGGRRGANAYGSSAGYSSYQGDASQYGTGYDVSAGGNFGGSYGLGYDQSSAGFGGASSFASSAYGSSAGGVFNDPNPHIIRRAAASGPVTYRQNILVRFLQPPPVPPPGPLIIKEVRPPQPPPPPPLYIRQRPPPPPILPPIVIRENPPRPPPALPAQVVTRMLPALPLPPRSVIIERLPPLPPKPRDVVVERWLPYRISQKRRVIIQRAPPVRQQRQRNIIIHYEAPRAQVIREFRNLGIQRADPRDYVARYGSSLEESTQLLSHARQAGVVEDISTPAGAAYHSSGFGSFQAGGAGGYNSASVGGYDQWGADSEYAGGYGAQSSFESASDYGASNYGYDGGLASGSQSWATSGYGSGGFDVAAAAFRQADINNDGTLDQEEFRQFAQSGY